MSLDRRHSIYVRYVPEVIRIPDMRLGRHIRRDSRDADYVYRTSGRPLVSKLHTRQVPILNQGNVGSCTGNAITGALGTSPVYDSLPPQTQGQLNEEFALTMYSAAEIMNGDGPYPPNDYGSDGPTVSKVARNAGYVSHYVHCMTVHGVLDAISWAYETGLPVIIGSDWFDSMDYPDSNGIISVSQNSVLRGGHEYLARGLDVDKQLLYLDNSWGTGWGLGGSFCYSFDTLAQLLGEEGDGCALLPLGASL